MPDRQVIFLAYYHEIEAHREVAEGDRASLRVRPNGGYAVPCAGSANS